MNSDGANLTKSHSLYTWASSMHISVFGELCSFGNVSGSWVVLWGEGTGAFFQLMKWRLHGGRFFLVTFPVSHDLFKGKPQVNQCQGLLIRSAHRYNKDDLNKEHIGPSLTWISGNNKTLRRSDDWDKEDGGPPWNCKGKQCHVRNLNALFKRDASREAEKTVQRSPHWSLGYLGASWLLLSH